MISLENTSSRELSSDTINRWTPKKFKHLIFPDHLYKKCVRIDGNEIGRLYRTEEGKVYPSITTVLSIEEKPELENWKKAVGEKEAHRVSLAATTKGTYVHNMAEDYMMGNIDFSKANPLVKHNFLPLKRLLDDHVDNIFSSELKFYSDKLQVDGTTDLIADFDGVQCVIDYKTSNRIKYKQDIKDYFIQSSVYAMMAYEMFGLLIKDIIILMVVDGGETLVFKEKVADHMHDFVKIRKKFRKKYNI